MSQTETAKAPTQTTVAHFMPWSGMGGVEIATLRLVAATRDRFRHIVFCLHDAVDLRRAFDAMGIRTELHDPPASSIRHGLTYYRASQKIARMLRRERVDIVHFADLKAAQHNSFAALLAGCRMVCHVRVSVPTVSLRDRLCFFPIRKFLFVSQEARQTFGMRLPESQARVIYDAVDPPTFDPVQAGREARGELGIAAGRPIVGMVARISPQKDHLTLVNAAARVLQRFPDTLFLMVGDNALVPLNREHFTTVLARVHELGLRHAFLFTGHRTDIFRLTAAMDFCVLSTHREGFPLSILETMIMEKAVVATAVGGIPEIIQPGRNGFLHAHENSEDLAEHLCFLLDNPAEAQSMGQRAAQIVRHDYSPEAFTRHMTAVYHHLSGKHEHRHP